MIDPDTDIETGVKEALAPFDQELAVEPYREHLDHTGVRMMAKHYDIAPANLHALSKKMEDWNGQKGAVDREGLYSLSTHNPDGRWDWYEIGGRWNGHIPHARKNSMRAGTLANAPYLKSCLPYLILTPEGEWIEHERYYVSSDWKDVQKEAMDEEEWLLLVQKTLLRWPKHRVVCVDIHC